MATLRQGNWIGQLRVDVSDIRGIESAVAADFDILAGKMLAGRSPLVVRGFSVATTGAAGNPASNLSLVVASGLLMHFGASEAGTLFVVSDTQAPEQLSSTNAKVSGSFAATATNYVGIDFIRSADATTTDLKQILDASTDLETPKTIPTARTLQYSIIITTTPFSANSNICPIAKVVTDVNNNVVSVTDARQLAFRLGSGSDNPNAGNFFPWLSRTENPITYNPSLSQAADPFSGGDKQLISLKNWLDAVMTRLWEVGGGQYWYSATARDNVKLVYGEPVLVSTGDNFSWNAGTSTLTWKSLSLVFENSPVYVNTVTDGSAVLNADGQCLYVDVQRGTAAALSPTVGTLTSLPTPLVPGARFIIAWRSNSLVYTRDRPYEVGRVLPVATTSATGVVELAYTAGVPAAPLVAPLDANNAFTIGNGSYVTAASHTGITGYGGTDILSTSAAGTGVTGNGGTATNDQNGGYGVTGQGGSAAGGGTAVGGSGVFGAGGSSGSSGLGGTGVQGSGGGNAGYGVFGQGAGFTVGSPSFSGGGAGVKGVGGNVTGGGGFFPTAPGFQQEGKSAGVVGFGANFYGGDGGQFFGTVGNFGTGQQNGVYGQGSPGGTSGGSQNSGVGGRFLGGSGQASNGQAAGGDGLVATGGNSGGGSAFGGGGAGITATGGNTGNGTGVSGVGGHFIPGTSQTTAIKSDGFVDMSGGTNPSSSTGFNNVLTKANVCKCWGVITTGASGGLSSGFNITSITLTSTFLTVTMATGLSSSNGFCAVASPVAVSQPYFCTITYTGNANQFDIKVWNQAGTIQDLTSLVMEINVVVFGLQ